MKTCEYEVKFGIVFYKHWQHTSSEMELEPESYKKISGPHERDARDILVGLPSSITQGVDTILEIGCGTGTVTNMVAQTIRHRRYIAMDVDPAMLDFARSNNTGSIEFIQQDCGLPHAQLNQEVKALDGSVDVVWSNYAFHWIPPSRLHNAIEMVHRSLKPGGVAYINVALLPPVLEFCSEELRCQLEKIMVVPSTDEQLASYKEHFQRAGFTSVEFSRGERDWTYETVEKFRILRRFASVYGVFLPESVTQEEREKYFRALEGPMIGCLAQKHDGTSPRDMNEARTMHYCYAWFVVTK